MRIGLFDYQDLNVVVLIQGDKDTDCNLCTGNSKFIHGSVFSTLKPAFELSNSDFSYYQQTAYNKSSIVSLRNHLQDYISKYNMIKDSESLELVVLKQIDGLDFMNEIRTFYPKWRIEWEKIRDQLIRVIKDIIEIVDDCIDEEKVFWVKGY